MCLRFLTGLSMVATLSATSLSAQAQPLAQGRPGPVPGPGGAQDRIYSLENDVRRLEQVTYDLSRRLEMLERSGRPQPPPSYPREISCLIVDTGFSKTHLGTASSRLDAEINARKACENSVHASYCGDARSLRCDESFEPRARSYVCLVVDTGFGKSFRGEGKTQIAAEASAKQACQNSVHSSYCGNTKARCEPVF